MSEAQKHPSEAAMAQSGGVEFPDGVKAMLLVRNLSHPEMKSSPKHITVPSASEALDIASNHETRFHVYLTKTYVSRNEYKYDAYLWVSSPEYVLVNGSSIARKTETSGIVRPASPGWLLDDGDVINMAGIFEYTVRLAEREEQRVRWTGSERLQYLEHIRPNFTLTDRLLGSGSSSRAFLAYDERTNEQVVCKIINMSGDTQETIDRLQDSTALMSRFRHPNVTSLRRAYFNATTLWVFEELAGGGNLESLLQSKDTNTTWPEVIYLVRQILEGVAHIHARGVVHRDLKPANILCAVGYDRKHRLAITDFDLAMDNRDIAWIAEEDRPWGAGTYGFRSPEMMRWGKLHDKPTDIWSVGVIVAQLLTGNLGFLNALTRYPSESAEEDEEGEKKEEEKGEEEKGEEEKGEEEKGEEEDEKGGNEEEEEDTGHETSDPMPEPFAFEKDSRFFLNLLDTLGNHSRFSLLTREIILTTFPPIRQDDDFQRGLNTMDYIKDNIRDITRNDPTDEMDERNHQVITETVNTLLEERWERFPSVWFGIIEGLLLKHFLRGLLIKDARKRMTARQALEHPWLTLTRGVFFYLDLIPGIYDGSRVPSGLGELEGPDWLPSPQATARCFWWLLTHGELPALSGALQGSRPTLKILEHYLPENNKSWATLRDDHYRKADAVMEAEMEWLNAQDHSEKMLEPIPDNNLE